MKKLFYIFSIFFIISFSKCNPKKEKINELDYPYSPLQPLGYYNFNFNKNEYPNWDCLREMNNDSDTSVVYNSIILPAPYYNFKLSIIKTVTIQSFSTFTSDSVLINNDSLNNKE